MPAGSGFTRPGVQYTSAEYANASYIEQFKMKAREWHSRYLALQKMKLPASMEGQRNRLVSLGDSVKAAINKVTEAMDAVGLSALPLVAAAVVAAALAAIAWWNSSYDKFVSEARKKVFDEQYQKYLAAGATPQEAQRMAQSDAAALVKSDDEGPLSFIFKNWQPLVVIIGGIMVYRWINKER